MSILTIKSQPVQGASVFNEMIYEFEYNEGDILGIDNSGNFSVILVSAIYEDILILGSSLRIINGTLAGTYSIAGNELIPNNLLRVTLFALFNQNLLQSGSNKFAPETFQDFDIFTGYEFGDEALIKPWQKTSVIRVNPNIQGVLKFDISGFLKSRFEITEPLQGANVPISLRYFVKPSIQLGIPSDENSRTVYYGLENLTQPQQDGSEAIGERPILFFGNVPTLYSLAGEKGIVNNFISNPDQDQLTTSQNIIKLDLLSCEAKEILWLGSSPSLGFVSDPVLPDWIQATSEGNNIELIINPCTGGVGDYLADDYNPADYLTGGQLNSVTGCFSFVFSLDSETLFTLNICVTPVSELINVCKDDVLNIAWLNQLGGYSSFAIEGKYIAGRVFGNDQTIITSNNILKRVEFLDVYETFEIRGGVLSKIQLDLLQSLRSSIQAYLFNQNTQAWDIPIVIDRSSFSTYGNKFNQAETRFAFSFKLSRLVKIQTQ